MKPIRVFRRTVIGAAWGAARIYVIRICTPGSIAIWCDRPQMLQNGLDSILTLWAQFR
ncbi:MAG TPA: hypothetical protein V6C84_03415 [Coleofasciculaceae cyanobacterium]